MGTPAPITKGKGGDKAGSNPAPGPASATASAPAEKKTRTGGNMAKQLAIAIAGLVAILAQPKLANSLTEPEKAQVAAASEVADELNAKTIKPIQDRIKAIEGEFKELAKDFLAPGVAEKAKDLSIELARQQKKLLALTSAAAAA